MLREGVIKATTNSLISGPQNFRHNPAPTESSSKGKARHGPHAVKCRPLRYAPAGLQSGHLPRGELGSFGGNDA